MAQAPRPPVTNRALRMNSAQTSDRLSSRNDEDPRGGDTILSDSSSTGDAGASSPLDIGQFDRGYTANQVPDAGSPMAGGGYQETDAERAVKMQREQSQGRRLQAQLVGAGGGFGEGGEARQRPGIAEAEQEIAMAAVGADGARPGAQGGQDEGGDEEEGEEDQAMDMQQQKQQDKTAKSKIEKVKEVQKKIKDAKEKIAKYKKKLKWVKNVSEGSEAGMELLDGGTDMGLSLLALLVEMNVLMINKYTFKITFIPEQSLPEDALTMCVDCTVCMAPVYSPPCCFITVPIIFFLSAMHLLKSDPLYSFISTLVDWTI